MRKNVHISLLHVQILIDDNIFIDQQQLKTKATWTMNGVVFPPDQKRGKTKPRLSKRFKYELL